MRMEEYNVYIRFLPTIIINNDNNNYNLCTYKARYTNRNSINSKK